MKLTFEVDTNDTTTTKILYKIADLFEELDKGKTAPVPAPIEKAVAPAPAKVETPEAPAVQPPAPVASAQPGLTLADLQKAAGELIAIDKSKSADIKALINAAGAASFSQLSPDKIGQVAQGLQALGAVIA